MASTVRFEVTQKELDASDDVFDEKSYVISSTYSTSIKLNSKIPSSNTFFPVSFGTVSTASLIRLNSDQALSFNAGTQVFENVKDVIFKGTFTEMNIKNTTGNEATVIIEIYGE